MGFFLNYIRNKENIRIKKYNKWTISSNCAYFASKVWNDVVPKKHEVSAGLLPTPKKLCDSIRKKNTYILNIKLPKVKTAYRFTGKSKKTCSSATLSSKTPSSK